jgi:hypothetical protein
MRGEPVTRDEEVGGPFVEFGGEPYCHSPGIERDLVAMVMA